MQGNWPSWLLPANTQLTLDAFCRRVGDVGESRHWWGNCSCISIWDFSNNSLDLWKMLPGRLLREVMPWLPSIRNRIGGIPFVNVNWYVPLHQKSESQSQTEMRFSRRKFQHVPRTSLILNKTNFETTEAPRLTFNTWWTMSSLFVLPKKSTLLRTGDLVVKSLNISIQPVLHLRIRITCRRW